jgi:hypothetical protein
MKGREGMSRVSERKTNFEVIIDNNITDKMIALVRVESDTGTLKKTIFCRKEYDFNIDIFKKELKPKKYLKIILLKNVGTSNIK